MPYNLLFIGKIDPTEEEIKVTENLALLINSGHMMPDTIRMNFPFSLNSLDKYFLSLLSVPAQVVPRQESEATLFSKKIGEMFKIKSNKLTEKITQSLKCLFESNLGLVILYSNSKLGKGFKSLCLETGIRYIDLSDKYCVGRINNEKNKLDTTAFIPPTPWESPLTISIDNTISQGVTIIPGLDELTSMNTITISNFGYTSTT